MNAPKAFCPILSGVPCPKGAKAAKECLQEISRKFDPIADINDFLMLNCAIAQAQKFRVRQKR